MMGADHGAVDHLQGTRHGLAMVQGVHDLFPEPSERPALELAIHARPFSEDDIKALEELFKKDIDPEWAC